MRTASAIWRKRANGCRGVRFFETSISCWRPLGAPNHSKISKRLQSDARFGSPSKNHYFITVFGPVATSISRKRANGCRVAPVPCTVCDACAQNQGYTDSSKTGSEEFATKKNNKTCVLSSKVEGDELAPRRERSDP